MTSQPNAFLQALFIEFQNWRVKEFPEYATTAEVHEHNDRLETLSLERFKIRKQKCNEFLAQLNTIKRETLINPDQASYDILEDYLRAYIEGYKWRYYSACNPVIFLENIHVSFKSFLIEATPFLEKKDFLNYAQRLRCIPNQVSEQIALMKEAISNQTTLHRVSVEKVPEQLAGIVKEKMELNLFYSPCRNNIEAIEEDKERTEICNLIKSVIIEEVNPALVKLRIFLEDEYIHATRKDVGVCSLPNGIEFYKACLRWHLSDDILPEDVHQRGLDEVSRIRNCFQDVMNRTNFNGNLKDFFSNLRQDKSHYYTNKDDLLVEYKDILQKRINPRLEMFFTNAPKNFCDIRPMPFDGPLGFYNPPARDGSRPGVFQVNLTHPEMITRFGMPSLTLHEANPGHHMQASHALHLSIPSFRKKIDFRNLYSAPMLFPVYTAYSEGWAMYAEDLGVEMNVYETQYEMVGKLTDEMYRACRLVVDTGLHYFGWSKEKAMEYMSTNCMMPLHKIENEVNRYITWPGQACGYKIGQMKMKELRARAEKQLGPEFDIKEFHDTILNMPSVPLRLLDKHVDQWIKEKRS